MIADVSLEIWISEAFGRTLKPALDRNILAAQMCVGSRRYPGRKAEGNGNANMLIAAPQET